MNLLLVIAMLVGGFVILVLNYGPEAASGALALIVVIGGIAVLLVRLVGRMQR